MMHKIETEDVIDGFHVVGDFVPHFVVVGETELEAVDIYCLLYNAYMITTASGNPMTNVKGSVIENTYISGFENFSQLKRYFVEVNGTILKMTRY